MLEAPKLLPFVVSMYAGNRIHQIIVMAETRIAALRSFSDAALFVDVNRRRKGGCRLDTDIYRQRG